MTCQDTESRGPAGVARSAPMLFACVFGSETLLVAHHSTGPQAGSDRSQQRWRDTNGQSCGPVLRVPPCRRLGQARGRLGGFSRWHSLRSTAFSAASREVGAGSLKEGPCQGGRWGCGAQARVVQLPEAREPDPPCAAPEGGGGQADFEGEPVSRSLPRLGAFERTSGTRATGKPGPGLENQQVHPAFATCVFPTLTTRSSLPTPFPTSASAGAKDHMGGPSSPSGRPFRGPHPPPHPLPQGSLHQPGQ